MKTAEILRSLGVGTENFGAVGKQIYKSKYKEFDSLSPIDNSKIASIFQATDDEYEQVISDAAEQFKSWREYPAPKRGEMVRQIGNLMRENISELGYLVSLETGKILAEGIGEIQEAIDIADFAVGLSRQLYGLSMHSERASHRMYEQWHPLGVVGVITAFNFPAAVWAWNAMIAAVCGDVVVWKPSEQTPLIAVAMQNIASKVASEHGFPAVFNLLVSDGPRVGEMLAKDKRVPLISATGSCRMGRSVAVEVSQRLGKLILELGGNNAVIIAEDADLDLVIPSTVFGSVGTAGQRCTTTRRVFVHQSLVDNFINRMLNAYKQVVIGNPLEQNVLMGPLINQFAVDNYLKVIAEIPKQGGQILCGGKLVSGMPSNLYVEPTIVRAPKEMPLLKEETFAPILYVVSVENVSQAIELNNQVDQGLSSAIFTRSLAYSEQFLSHTGSDCGIANVNLGTSGAEIGGAFGGEKDTGGGRESGSDSWKQYMRRQTNTINFSKELPLAQGIKFDL